jgi:hypothetical protein
VPDVFYGGARGGGKSAGLLMDFAGHAHRYGPKARGILFRRSYPEFEELERQARDFYGVLGWKWTAQGKTWEAPNGATLRLRYLERDADADNYQGHSYTWAGVDEAGSFPTPTPIDKIRACLNRIQGVAGVLRLTGNPGGVGHQWLKRRYVDPCPDGGEPFTSEVGKLAVYIPSGIDDNPSLGEDYETDIKASTYGNDALWKAWRYGDWNAVAGAAFAEWRAEHHIMRARSDLVKGDKAYIAMDWGYKKGAAILAFGSPNRLEIAESVALERITAREAGALLATKWRGYRPEFVVYSPDMDAEVGMGNTLTQEFRDGWSAVSAAPPMIGGVQKAGSRRAKKVLVHQALSIPPEGVPFLRFWETATDILATLPVLPIDPKDPNDVDTKADDHAYDALGFLLGMIPPPAPTRREAAPLRENQSGVSWDTGKTQGAESRKPPDRTRPPFRMPRRTGPSALDSL